MASTKLATIYYYLYKLLLIFTFSHLCIYILESNIMLCSKQSTTHITCVHSKLNICICIYIMCIRVVHNSTIKCIRKI